jgi:hypothetical protein
MSTVVIVFRTASRLAFADPMLLGVGGRRGEPGTRARHRGGGRAPVVANLAAVELRTQGRSGDRPRHNRPISPCPPPIPVGARIKELRAAGGGHRGRGRTSQETDTPRAAGDEAEGGVRLDLTGFRPAHDGAARRGRPRRSRRSRQLPRLRRFQPASSQAGLRRPPTLSGRCAIRASLKGSPRLYLNSAPLCPNAGRLVTCNGLEWCHDSGSTNRSWKKGALA